MLTNQYFSTIMHYCVLPPSPHPLPARRPAQHSHAHNIHNTLRHHGALDRPPPSVRAGHSPRRTSAAAVAAAALAIGIDTTDESVAKGAFLHTHTWAQKVQAAVGGG